jgi:acid phosphatase (class A)
VLLPPPPDVASAEQRSDQAQVASAVAGRSPRQFFVAEDESARDVFFYTPSVGAGFTPQRLPVTAAFFARIGSDVKKLVDEGKAYWERPRPDGAEKRRGSYPSGHAAFAAASAIVLAQLVPAKRDTIFTQARTFAENRILLGLHYPSDVASGWTAGTLAAYVMMRDGAFQRDFAAAKAELRRANL